MKKMRGMLLLLACAAVWSTSGYAENVGGAKDGGVKKYGVVHNIADDREIERVGGIYEPEGLDKYIKRLFEQVFEQLDSIESRLGDMEKKMTDLQASAKKMDTALEALKPAAVATAEEAPQPERAALVL